MQGFDFLTAGRISFGRGRAAGAAQAARGFGDRVLLVRGGSVGFADSLATELRQSGAEVTEIRAHGEPDLAQLEAAVATGRAATAGVVLAIGGGSAIDLGKAAAALIPASRPAMAYLEVVGEGRPLDAAPLPFIALPTTAGTGAEVTKNAVIALPEHRRKVSLRDDRMLANLAIVDPGLTDGCPRGVTLASGLDAITQAIEPYLSHRATPLTDALVRDAIPRGLRALARLMQVEDPEARDELAFTSLVGGLALANAGLGAVHGLAGVLGGHTGAAHGALCGRLLPEVLRANAEAARQAGDPGDRHDEVAGWIGAALGGTGDPIDRLRQSIDDWGLPRLAALDANQRDEIACESQASSSMAANRYPLSVEVLTEILQRSG